MRKYLKKLLLLLFLVPFAAGAQEGFRSNSLIRELENESSDSVRCRLMLELASDNIMTDTVLAQEYLQKVKSLAGNLEDKNYLGRCFEIEGEMKTHLGHYENALIDFDRALALYNEADNDVAYYETLKDKGNAYLFMGDYGRAMNYYETALDYYRRSNMVEGASRCLNNMGIIYKNQGNYVEALSVYEESINIIDSDKDPMSVAKGYINMGNVFVFLGSYERALEYFERSREIAERAESKQDIALCLINSGVVQNKCGNYPEALPFYRRALELGEEIGDPVMVSNCLINIGTNYSAMGRHEEGLSYVEMGRKIKVELGDVRTISNCLINMAEIHSKMDDHDQAAELFMEAIPVKKELGDTEGLVRCYLGLSVIAFDLMDYARADQMADRALESAAEINSLEHITTGYGIKKDIAESRGDYHSAYHYVNLFDLYGDSLMNEATKRAAMEMEFKHRSRSLERENNNLKIQSELTAQLIRKRSALMRSAIGIAILLAALVILAGYFLRRLRHSSLKLEEKNYVITRQNMELDNINRNKDKMMSIIAHDLRGTIGNQLTAIDVLHRVEASGQKDFDRKKLLGNLKHSASYSLELLENLLLWSRLEEGSNFFNPEDISLDVIINACISLFDEAAMIKKLSVKKNVEEGIMIRADRIMFEAIVRNLLSNAIKFSESGRSIEIFAGIIDDHIQLKVTDEGVGMSEETINKIGQNGGFSSRGTANEKGAGIGMTLIREFTSLHKGKLLITSKPGEGTSILLSFPGVS